MCSPIFRLISVRINESTMGPAYSDTLSDKKNLSDLQSVGLDRFHCCNCILTQISTKKQ